VINGGPPWQKELVRESDTISSTNGESVVAAFQLTGPDIAESPLLACRGGALQ